jgi:hypothetical protein
MYDQLFILDVLLQFFVCSLCLHIQRQHEWLQKGWVMEVRASGEKTDKMYKVYIHEFS